MDSTENFGSESLLQGNQHTEILVRRPGEKHILKEKFVAIYEAFFQVHP